MTGTEDRELIGHTVEIDEYASVVLRIPKVLTAIDLKSLMHKANKLFNLAEIPLVPQKKGQGRGYVSLSEEEKRNLVKRYDKADDSDRQRMADKLGIGLKALYQKVWTIRKDIGIPVGNRKNNSKKKYSDEFVAKATAKLKTQTVQEVADDFKMDRKVLYDLVLSRTGKTPKMFRGG